MRISDWSSDVCSSDLARRPGPRAGPPVRRQPHARRNRRMTSHLNLSRDGHVALIELNRPEKLNAMTPEMADLLVQAVAGCNADDAVRAVVQIGRAPV